MYFIYGKCWLSLPSNWVFWASVPWKGGTQSQRGAVHGPNVGSAPTRRRQVRLAVYLPHVQVTEICVVPKWQALKTAAAASLPHRLAQPRRCYRAENTLAHMYRQWSSLICAAVNTNDVINRRPARLAQTIEYKYLHKEPYLALRRERERRRAASVFPKLCLPLRNTYINKCICFYYCI